MDAGRFEQQFVWVTAYAHELREAAGTLEQEGGLYMSRAAKALREKGPREALAALAAVDRTIDAIKGRVKELDDAFRAIADELGR
jgi:hypothetical protein